MLIQCDTCVSLSLFVKLTFNFWLKNFSEHILYIYIYSSIMTTLEGLSMVHDNVNVFGFGGIDMLRCCGRGSTETCYCQ